MDTPKAVLNLIERFDLHRDAKHERGVLQRPIAATDNEIDRLVYELYELTDEEIAIVEKR